MLIYLFIILYLLLSLFLKVDKENKLKKIWMIVTFLTLTTISACRAISVGTDTWQYHSTFKTVSILNWNQLTLVRYEYGFLYLNKIISYISKDPQILILFSSVLIVPFVGYFIYRNSKNVVFSTLLYILFNIYFFEMTGMRQSIAISFLLIAFQYLNENKKIKFSLWVILASLFHSSSIIFLIVLLLNKFNYKKNFYYYTIIVSAVFFVFFKPIFIFVSSLLGKYSGYMDSDEFGVSNYFGAFFQFLLTIVIYTFCHILYIKLKKNNNFEEKNFNTEQLSLKLLSIDVVCQSMAMKMNIIGRMNQYFWIYSIIIIPNLINRVTRTKDRMLLYFLIFILAFAYWLIVGIFRPEWNGAIPYVFYK